MYTITAANVNVMVEDMDRSVAFYQKIGLGLKQRWGNHYALVEAPGVIIGLHPGGKAGKQTTNISVGFIVEKLDEARSKLDELGLKYENAEDMAGNFVNFTDPDGTPLYFMQMKAGNW